jgi:hypothetical protein
MKIELYVFGETPYCWVIFGLIKTLLLSLQSFVIHHTFIVYRFYREKFCIKRLFQPSFDDGLLTCCGVRCGIFCICDGLSSLLNTFWQLLDELGSSQFTIRFCAAARCLFFQGYTSFGRCKGTFLAGTEFSLYIFLLLNCMMKKSFLYPNILIVYRILFNDLIDDNKSIVFFIEKVFLEFKFWGGSS